MGTFSIIYLTGYALLVTAWALSDEIEEDRQAIYVIAILLWPLTLPLGVLYEIADRVRLWWWRRKHPK